MPKLISLLNKNNLPTFMEEFIGAAAKTMDEYDVLGNDGWLSSVPFGKLAGFLVKQMVEIKDLDKALRRAVGFSIGAAFSQGLLRNKLKPTIQEEDYKAFRANLKQLLADKGEGSQDFAVADFNNATVVQAFRKLLDGLLDTAIMEEASRNRVKRFVSDYSKINFVRLLEQNKAVYGKLAEHLQSESYQLALEQASKEKYYSELRNMYTEVTLNDDEGMTLDAIYVEPKFKVFEKCLKEGSYKKDNKAFVSQDELLIGWTLTDLLLAWLSGKPISDKLKELHPRFILLYGYPGQGKTSLCKRLLHDLSEEESLQQPHYFARFRNLEKPEGLKTELLYTLATHLTEEKDLPVDKRALRSSFLLLDGLDELLMKNRLKSSDVEDICRTILEQSGKHDEMKVLVTSRYGYVETENLSPGEVLILQIDEMDLTQQTSWLQKYKTFHDQSWLSEGKLKEINDEHSNSYLKELITQPILLHMVASLTNPIGNEVNRASVYQALFDQITDPRKWKKEGQIPALKGLNAGELRVYLRELAYAVFVSGENYIHKSEVEKLKATEKFRKQLKGADFEKVLRALMIAFYFQEVNKKKTYSDDEDHHQYAIEFLHKSLQEYLTAEKIWHTFKKKFLFASEREYALDDELEALKFCQDLFGKQPLSQEIMDYLREIIQNYEDKVEKKKLATRLLSFLDYFLERDFVYAYQASKNKKPLDLGVQNFYGYFLVLVYLAPDMNVLEDIKAPARLANLLHLSTRFCLLELNLSGCYLPMANLKSVKLSRTDLSGANLRNADLRNANLRNADLRKADLIDANLRNANLIEAHLRKADLRKADLRDANLSNADLSNADLSNADLRNADLSEADLRNVDLIDADLIDADLIDADLIDANLSKADLSNADLSNADLLNADLSNADLSNADLSNADLIDADLSNANLVEANLRNANLRNANLIEAHLSDANLIEADLSDANLIDANLIDADLSKADLIDADLSKADLIDADLSNANLIDADLRDADLSNANLRNADLRNANLRNANLRDADLRNADLRNTNLRNTNLRNADLIKADLHGTELNYKQLKVVRTLYKATGLSEEFMEELKQEKPALFEDPDDMTD